MHQGLGDFADTSAIFDLRTGVEDVIKSLHRWEQAEKERFQYQRSSKRQRIRGPLPTSSVLIPPMGLEDIPDEVANDDTDTGSWIMSPPDNASDDDDVTLVLGEVPLSPAAAAAES